MLLIFGEIMSAPSSIPMATPWMIGTHKADPSAKEMKKGMFEMMKQQPGSTTAADGRAFTRKELAVIWSLGHRENY